MEAVATLCGFCKTREMIPVLNAAEEDTGFVWCPNCDNPKGITPPPDPDEEEVTADDLSAND